VPTEPSDDDNPTRHQAIERGPKKVKAMQKVHKPIALSLKIWVSADKPIRKLGHLSCGKEDRLGLLTLLE
jgi:hypothetical protein